MTELVSTQRKEGVLKIAMCRPEKKNAITTAMYQEMTKQLIAANDDDTTHCVVLAGADTCFTAGNDLKDFLDFEGSFEDSPACQFLFALNDFKKPLIASVESLAVGIGVTMLLHCDYVCMAEGAALKMPFTQLALVPEAASSMLLPATVGYQRAAQLLLLSEGFSAEQAYDWGLVNQLCKRGETDQAAMVVARRFGGLPINSLINTKALLKRPAESIKERISAEGVYFERQIGSDEAKAVFKAFLGK